MVAGVSLVEEIQSKRTPVPFGLYSTWKQEAADRTDKDRFKNTNKKYLHNIYVDTHILFGKNSIYSHTTLLLATATPPHQITIKIRWCC
jgi:hypothetical protein